MRKSAKYPSQRHNGGCDTGFSIDHANCLNCLFSFSFVEVFFAEIRKGNGNKRAIQ